MLVRLRRPAARRRRRDEQHRRWWAGGPGGNGRACSSGSGGHHAPSADPIRGASRRTTAVAALAGQVPWGTLVATMPHQPTRSAVHRGEPPPSRRWRGRSLGERWSPRRIGIDEISYKRHHRYLTVVVDHDSGRLVWAAPGRPEPPWACSSMPWALSGPPRLLTFRPMPRTGSQSGTSRTGTKEALAVGRCCTSRAVVLPTRLRTAVWNEQNRNQGGACGRSLLYFAGGCPAHEAAHCHLACPFNAPSTAIGRWISPSRSSFLMHSAGMLPPGLSVQRAIDRNRPMDQPKSIVVLDALGRNAANTRAFQFHKLQTGT